MRVTYDDQIFTMQRRGGISRYFVQIINAFREDAGLAVDPTIAWRWTRNHHALSAGLGASLPVLGGSSGRVIRMLNRTGSFDHTRADLAHRTYYRADYLRRNVRMPTAVTVYDMTPEVMPHLFPGGNPHQNKQNYVRGASVVFCISENTRQDLLRVYGAIDATIIVTPLGVTEEFRSGVAAPLWCPNDYILFVGNRSGYKDFQVVVEGLAELGDRGREVSLLAIGGGAFTEAETALMSRWGLGRRVFQRGASDGELPGIYAGAQAFVFPSRYEGFGLPALEAMACGTPSVLADSSSLPEVGGDAALYFAPGDSSQLVAQLDRLLHDVAVRQDLSSRGPARAREFTWGRTASETARGYRIAVAAGSN